MTYTMSRDYDVLYDLLCAGGEAIAMTTDGLMKASQESQELDGGSRERFSESCTRLNLEFVAPVDLAGILAAGDELTKLKGALSNLILSLHPSARKGHFTMAELDRMTRNWTTATAQFRK